jgi:hypothetical protein
MTSGGGGYSPWYKLEEEEESAIEIHEFEVEREFLY